MKQSQKIAVVTTTRADYGLLKSLMQAIKESPHFSLQVIASGSHLSHFHGNTYQEIEEDQFKIDAKVDLKLMGDQPKEIAASAAEGITGFVNAFHLLNPDLIIILGDRYEILSVAIAAMFSKIPIAHLHGGELTEGAIDDGIRHAVTKLSHFHFVANESYKTRVLQLGENPENTFNVGGLGVDAIRTTVLLTNEELEQELGLKFKSKNLLITFHPETLSDKPSNLQLQELLDALESFPDTQLIFTMPNADPENKILRDMIEAFVDRRDNANSFISLGQKKYLSCIAQVDAVVGNSSSGLAEAPSFKKATINIGKRQTGRILADSVITCNAIKLDIIQALNKIYTPEFQKQLKISKNPYGDGGAVSKIIKILPTLDISSALKKSFIDK